MSDIALAALLSDAAEKNQALTEALAITEAALEAAVDAEETSYRLIRLLAEAWVLEPGKPTPSIHTATFLYPPLTILIDPDEAALLAAVLGEES